MSTAEIITETALEESEASRFRTQIGHISRQSTVFFAGTVFTAASAYVFKVYLARVLGAEALGVYTLGMTIVGFLGIFNALGLPQSAVKFVAKYSATGDFNRLRGFLVRAFGWLTISNVALGGFIIVAGPWIGTQLYHTPALKSYIYLFAAIALFGALNTFLGQVLAGYKDVSRRTLITNFIGSPLMMLFTVALVSVGFGLWGYIFAQIASAVAVLVLLVLAAWRLTPKLARSDLSVIPRLDRRVVSFSALAFGVAFLEFVIAQADKILIGFYLNPREVGIYAVAAALVAFIPIILQSVNQIFSPIIAELHTRHEHALLERIYQTLTKWIIGFTIPLAAVIAIFAPALMKMFGKDFVEAWPVLVVGTIGQLVNCSVGSVGYLLLMSGNQVKLIRIQAFAGAFMIGLNLLLVPRWGIMGAAVAAAATNMLTNIVCLVQVKKTLKMFPYAGTYIRLLPPCVASILLLVYLRFKLEGLFADWLTIGVCLFSGYLAFVCISWIFGLDSNDRLIAEAIRSKMSGLVPRKVGGLL